MRDDRTGNWASFANLAAEIGLIYCLVRLLPWMLAFHAMAFAIAAVALRLRVRPLQEQSLPTVICKA